MDHHILSATIAFSLLFIQFSFLVSDVEAGVVGVNYGMLGNNLPSPDKVIPFLKSKNITRVRLFDPNQDALNALQGSGIEVVLGTLNQDLPTLATSPSFAHQWVQTNMVPYAKNVKFRCISAGNEVIPSDLAVHVLPSMKNLDTSIRNAGLTILVSTTVSTAILGTAFPPSQGEFGEGVVEIMKSISDFLIANSSPLLVNVYPYFSYIYDPKNIALDYALFTSRNVVVRDGGLNYTNLFDAITDATYAALEKVGGQAVDIIVSESGWPSAENADIATIGNARTYNNNLVKHVSGSSGTPRRPEKGMEGYVFAIFNENLKPPGTEQHFGLYHPNMTEVYHVSFPS